VEAAYNQGRYDAEHEYVWFIASHRAGRLLNQSAVQFDEGIRLFRAGRYEKALVNWLGAAEANHDSAAPRLHAGHAMFALGRYREAVMYLARAFELQPLLAYQTYDIRDEYGDRSHFDEHLDTLRSFVGKRPNDADGLTLLGYVTYYTQGPGASDKLLRRAARCDPKSYFIPKLLEVSGKAQSTPTPRDASRERPARQPGPGATSPSQSTNVLRVKSINL
jgi:tetratricopeptide (TPR) repeat protein